MRPTKRPRRAHDDPPRPSAPARASLVTLPIEILAEILLATRSPPTVLAVSRTSSFLYHSLALNPAASFIWRGVRQSCEPMPLPDPDGLWKKSEADYAAFLFSGGVCEVCGRNARAMYTSFAARIRLCGSWHCRKKMRERLVSTTDKSIWVPFVESNHCFHPSDPVARDWPYASSYLLRKTDLDEFNKDSEIYTAAEQAQTSEEDERRARVVKRCNAQIQSFPKIMEFSVRLSIWKNVYDSQYKEIKRTNRRYTATLAMREGWNLQDLVVSQTYGSMQRRKNFLLELISAGDVSSIRTAIEAELVTLRAHHNRQTAEEIYKEKLTEIKKIYERIRCGTLPKVLESSDSGESLVLPPLSVFCTLPSVRALKGSPDPNTAPPTRTPAASDIKSSSLALSLIRSDIRTWLVPVRKQLRQLLGYPATWQSASSLAAPPEERVTARFFCRRCGEGQVGRGYQRELCLDFKGVCSHVCVVKQGKSTEGEAPQEEESEEAGAVDEDGQEKRKGRRRKKGVKVPEWKADLFVKDEKAICVIKKLLGLEFGTPFVKESSSTADVKTIAKQKRNWDKSELKCIRIDQEIRCMSCKGWVTMDFETAIGHAHRHESMQVEIVRSLMPLRVAVTELVQWCNASIAFERGTVETLLGHRGKNGRKKIDYGCRHCLLVENAKGEPQRTLNGMGVRPMTFDGLRSHVKEKHGIRDIRDEDLFTLFLGSEAF